MAAPAYPVPPSTLILANSSSSNREPRAAPVRRVERKHAALRRCWLPRASSDGDRGLAPDLPRLQVSDGLRDLVQGVGPVDLRRHPAGLDEVGEPVEVSASLLVHEGREPLADEDREQQRPELPAHPAREVAAVLSTHEHDGPSWSERPAQPREP